LGQLLVRNGWVALSTGTVKADLVVDGDKIRTVSSDPSGMQFDREIDAEGCYVLPGGVDPHVHTNLALGEYTTRDDFAEVTRAAALGGTTTIVDFAIPARQEASPLETFHARLEEATGLTHIDFGLHATLSRVDREVLDEIRELFELGAHTFKMFTVYRGLVMVSLEEIFAALGKIAEVGGLALIHAESNHLVEATVEALASRGNTLAAFHPESRPTVCEVDAVQAVINMLRITDAMGYFVHVSTPEALEIVRTAQGEGVRVWAETCPHYLILDEGAYGSERGALYVCSPPLRSRRQADELWRRVLLGEVAIIGSDHCCYDTEQKFRYPDDFRLMPNGLPGVQTRLPVMFSEAVLKRGLPIERFVDLASTTPAKLNGLYPRKGVIQPGSDADLVVLDPTKRSVLEAGTLDMKTDYSPFDGLEVRGEVRHVIARGDVVVKGGSFVGGEHRGVFVESEEIVTP
jgi:dihydropyrimidinase